MFQTRREIVKRLRFNAEQELHLNWYLKLYDVRFTDLIHRLIQQELNRVWVYVHQSYDHDWQVFSCIPYVQLRTKRSSKNTVGRPVPDVDPKLLFELGRIGSNINQIARSLNVLCLQRTDVIQQFSFIECLEILVNIQSDLNQYLPKIPDYTISEQLAERRRAKAITRVQQEER